MIATAARRVRRGGADPAACLTDREIEILQAFLDNAGRVGAAYALGIAEGTVKNTLANARSKCGVQTTYQLVALAAHRLHPPRGVGRKAP